VVKVKKGSGSTAHWSIDFIWLSGWLRRCFTLLITPLDIDRIGQILEDSNSSWVSRATVQQRQQGELGGGLHDLKSSKLTNEVSLISFVTIVRVYCDVCPKAAAHLQCAILTAGYYP